MKEKKIYYRRLDIIRNISCIMVLLYHLNILPGGFLAVCTFFALSGYLTCMSALKKEKFSIKSYYINKAKSLYLPLIIVVFSTIMIFKILPNITWLNLKKETISVILGYNNFWQINANMDYFTKNANSPFIHLWYISILMQFELIFPIIFTGLKRLKGKNKENLITIVILLLTTATTILFYYMSITKKIMDVYYNTFARIFSILLGLTLALIHYEYGNKFLTFFKANNSLIFVIYTIILILLGIFISADSKNFAIFMILTSILSMRLIKYSIIQKKEPYRFEKLNVFLAKISYEIYLVQYPIIFFMQNIPINKIVKTLIIIALTFIFSTLIYLITNLKTKNKIINYLKILLIVIIISVGSFILITEKDHTEEMKELEKILNDNSEHIEQKNNDLSMNQSEQNKTKEEIMVATVENKNDEKKQEEDKTTKITEEKEKQVNDEVSCLPVVGIGDSVLLGAAKELYEKFPNGYFDGKVSRTLSAGETILKDLKSRGKLTNTVILALANNGDYSIKKNKELMEILGDRELYWVNAVGADDPTFNDKFEEFAKDYPNIHIVEWNVVSKGHQEYFYADGIHTKGEGIKKYAETIYNAIYQDYLKKSN